MILALALTRAGCDMCRKPAGPLGRRLTLLVRGEGMMLARRMKECGNGASRLDCADCVEGLVRRDGGCVESSVDDGGDAARQLEARDETMMVIWNCDVGRRGGVWRKDRAVPAGWCVDAAAAALLKGSGASGRMSVSVPTKPHPVMMAATNGRMDRWRQRGSELARAVVAGRARCFGRIVFRPMIIPTVLRVQVAQTHPHREAGRSREHYHLLELCSEEIPGT
jgi:hypothetical protein